MSEVSVTVPSNAVRLSVPTSVSVSATQQTSQQPQASTSVASTVVLAPVSSAGSPQELDAGRLVNVDGVGLCMKDEARNKILSIERSTVTAGKEGYAKSLWLRTESVKGNLNSVLIPKDATILSVGVSVSEIPTGTNEIKLYKNSELVATIGVPTDATSASNTGLNIDVAAGDRIKVFAGGEAAIKDPIVAISLAWRA